MTTWQPIETAPKDGSRILVYGEETMLAVVWGPYYDFKPVQGSEKMGWTIWDADVGGEAIHPTHWQPLPPPPNTGADK